MKNISLILTAGMTPEEKLHLVEMFNNSETMIERLKDVLKKKSNEAHNTQLSDKQYEKPSWAYEQAYLNGYQKAHEELIVLLTFRD